MIFDIINPSDKCTIEADDIEVAAVACLLLGGGQYALKEVGAESTPAREVPIFMFGGLEKWFQENIGGSLEDSMNRCRSQKLDLLVETLDGFLYGSAADREEFARQTKGMHASEVFRERLKWNEERRSSMNDIGKQARVLAHRFGQKEGA